ncbi:MAG: DUF4394 domain-containing protein [Gemmataceae bacterium]|nr:DUF4394 domain-containing protein [Gemmataceae bacterium]
MWFPKSFRKWFSTRRSAARPVRGSRNRARPTIESLENRVVPAYTATLVGTVVTFTGDVSADTLIFDVDGGGLLRHNRFTASDPGFASNVDLDSGTAGVQSITANTVTALSVDAGGGNDRVQITTGVALAMGGLVTLQGGLGDDILIGGATVDLIDGGIGNDFLGGGGGNDTLVGGEGNDTLDGDGGADQFFGGEGSDQMIWDPGDGNDLMEGGSSGQNVLIFNGGLGNDTFALTAVNNRLRFDRQPANIVLDVADAQTVEVNRDAAFTSALNGANEVPPVVTTATGTGTARFNSRANTIDVELTATGLSSAIVGAHIHVGATGVDGPIIVDLSGLSPFVADGGGVQRLILRNVPFPVANIPDLLAGNTYFNIHTMTNPDGEIRDQLNAAGAGQSGSDAFLVNNLSGTAVTLVLLNLGSNDAAPNTTDAVVVTGTPGGDVITVGPGAGNTVAVTGLPAEVRLGNAETMDRLIVGGAAGNDTLTATAAAGLVLTTLDGGTGNDTLTGGGTLVGGDGDDTSAGGDSADTLVGDGVGGALAVALTVNNTLLTFDVSNPSSILATTTITGLQDGEQIVGIDVRPATGGLYGVGITGGNTGRLYLIDPTTGAATLVGPGPFSTTLTGTNFGVDFNPSVDRIRFVGDAESNLRLNPDTGAIAGTDTDLNPAGEVVGSAYDRNFDGSAPTTLFGLDSGSDSLVRQGGVDGTPSPNGGVLTTIGGLGIAGGFDGQTGFDIDAAGRAFAALNATGTARLFSISLLSGQAILIGNIGDGTTAVRGLALLVGTGNDRLTGNAGNDILDGGPGNDLLDGGASSGGNNTLRGGPGTDSILVSGTPDADTVVVSQAGNVITSTVNGATGTNAITNIENAQFDIVPGADTTTIRPLTLQARVLSTTQPDLGQQFVSAAYVKFLGRFPGSVDFNFWLPVLGNQGQNAVANGIARSAEAATFTVRNFYVNFLAREADPAGLQFHVNLLLTTQSEEQTLSSILASDEFFARAQTLISTGTPEQRYVAALYQLLLNRTAGDADFAFWVPVVTSQGRGAVALGIQQSAEYRSLQIASFYSTLLNRQTPAPQDGIDFWLSTGLDLLSIKVGFASSAEFFANG